MFLVSANLQIIQQTSPDMPAFQKYDTDLNEDMVKVEK